MNSNNSTFATIPVSYSFLRRNCNELSDDYSEFKQFIESRSAEFIDEPSKFRIIIIGESDADILLIIYDFITGNF